MVWHLNRFNHPWLKWLLDRINRGSVQHWMPWSDQEKTGRLRAPIGRTGGRGFDSRIIHWHFLASKWPQRPDMSSYLKYMAQTTSVTSPEILSIYQIRQKKGGTHGGNWTHDLLPVPSKPVSGANFTCGWGSYLVHPKLPGQYALQ